VGGGKGGVKGVGGVRGCRQNWGVEAVGSLRGKERSRKDADDKEGGRGERGELNYG